MNYKDYVSERSQMIYDMRVVERRTLDDVAKHFLLTRQRIRQIIVEVERSKERKDRHDAAPRGSLGSMRLSLRIENGLLNANEMGSVDLLDFFSRVSHREMRMWPSIGKKSIKEFADEAIKIVGEDAVMRWLKAGMDHD